MAQNIVQSIFNSKQNMENGYPKSTDIKSFDLHKLYTSFVDRYLSTDKRADKIKDFSSFTKEFIKFVLQKIEKFPLTRTGYISSIHCSPLVSGLMIEIAPELHGLPTNARIITSLLTNQKSLVL